MKSTVIIVALAIVLLAVIANHGCESAMAKKSAVSRKIAVEDRQAVQQAVNNACNTFKSVCARINKVPILRQVPRVKRICGYNAQTSVYNTICVDIIPEVLQVLQGLQG